jgi:RNA polymerase sigma-70 factor (ECF subfamily)
VALIQALATLPETQRRVFVLFYIAGRTVLEIADQENVPEGTVKSWLHRARAAVAAQLTDHREETGNA